MANGETAAPLDGEQIFARAKAAYRARARPDFVTYTLVRSETEDGEPRTVDTYRSRIWYRSADRAALVRRLSDGTATGPLEFARVAFNQATDPGPPTTDIFEAVPPRGGTLPSPSPTADLRTIQSVRVSGELDYRVIASEQAGDAYHLWLEARRDPDRNRLRELWVDARSYDVREAIATDRLYFYGEAGGWLADLFDMTLDLQDGIPVIRKILSTTEVDADTRAYGPHIKNEYRFEDIAFPVNLPTWYFHPSEYRFHIKDAPGY
jgi:hypothetical protein